MATFFTGSDFYINKSNHDRYHYAGNQSLLGEMAGYGLDALTNIWRMLFLDWLSFFLARVLGSLFH